VRAELHGCAGKGVRRVRVGAWVSGGTPRVRRHRDCGSGTVAVLGAVSVLAAMTVGALFVVSAVVASHRAQAAADLAALAAAAALVRGDPAPTVCSAGAAVATRNGARLASCQAGPDLAVELSIEVDAAAARVGTATARSRAGPATLRGAG
jgi:secretion/DNA translocation related TadE-like protein